MNFLPTENITYKTKLKIEEIVERLSDHVEPEKTFRFDLFSSGSTKPYEGKISGDTFEIERIIGYRNAFLPRIYGIIEKDYDGTYIKVKMRLHVFAMVFLYFWCGGIGLFCIAVLTQFIDGSKYDSVPLLPLAMLLFAYVLTMASFKFESIKSKVDLQRIFEAEIIE